METPNLFVDLDGVLVDFDRGVYRIFGKLPSELTPAHMWARLAKTPGFYEFLGWMPDGKALWEFVRHLKPVILTGLPMGRWAEPQKRSWCARELGTDIQVLTCFSSEKAQVARGFCGKDRQMILVDDREKLRESWESGGGIFVFHRTAAESKAMLAGLGLTQAP